MTSNFKQVVDGQPRYLTDLMTEKAIQFLQENPPDQPSCEAADPGEENDLAGNDQHAETLARLGARCDQYRDTLAQ